MPDEPCETPTLWAVMSGEGVAYCASSMRNGVNDSIMNIDDFINGERLQNIAEMYLGSVEDITSNPVIFEQIEKHYILENIDCMFDNPRVLFLYPHHLRLFSTRLKYFTNSFVLITHNSDVNLVETNEYVSEILASPLLRSWWGQNLCFVNPKMRFLPIGLANTMWEHGDLGNFANLSFEKTNNLFVNFQIYTNVEKRRPCVDTLGEMLPMVTAQENLKLTAGAHAQKETV